MASLKAVRENTEKPQILSQRRKTQATTLMLKLSGCYTLSLHPPTPSLPKQRGKNTQLAVKTSTTINVNWLDYFI